jgi:hypothetical protein
MLNRMDHALQDAVSMELAQRIAGGLPEHPEWLDLARENLERWSRLNHESPSLLRCYREWQEILTREMPEICALLTAPTDDGQRIRQNSPFAGVLTAKEVWEIKSRHRHGTPAA